MKKIAIIGQGTAGSMSAAYLQKKFPIEIDWYFDPNIPAQSVGEGTTLSFPQFLFENLDFAGYNLKKILKGTPKHGIRKINWNGNGDFIHQFPVGAYGIHLSAVEFQKHVLNKIKNKVNIIPKNIKNYSDLDCDHIIDCSGKPDSYKDYNMSNMNLINSAYINQCYWDKPKFNYTLTIARPYGWVFGIPLQNRCSIGYLYNKDINTLEEVKEDIKNIFKKYNLTPSKDINSLSFKNYYKKLNFTERVTYNGNASFFLEPLEATSIDVIVRNLYNVNDILNGYKSINTANVEYNEFLQEIEHMLALHYYAGSKFDTKFWKNAKLKSKIVLEKAFHNRKFQNILQDAMFKKIKSNGSYGSWATYSYLENIKGLGLYETFRKYPLVHLQ